MIQSENPVPSHGRSADKRVGPVRTCVGCRGRELAVELLRVVAVLDGSGHGAVTVDVVGNLPGRGAWLHPDQECLHAAVRRRALGRALRITGSPDISGVTEHFSALTRSAPATEQGSEDMSTP